MIVRMERDGAAHPRRVVLGAAAAAVILAALAAPVLSQAPLLRPTEKLNWHGDAKAPDLSGVWVRVDGPGASKSKEGWLPWPPPLKPPFAATWAKRVADAAAGTRSDDPVQGCLPGGMPRVMSGMTGPMLLLQTPGRVMIYRDGIPVRRIWLDGRPFPAQKDLESFSNGTAMGHYEGADLVTEVRGIRDQPIDATGVPHSDDLRITERFHRVDADTLRVDITLTDPTAYTAPLKTSVTYAASKDPRWEPREFLCTPKTDYHPDAYVR